MVSQYVEIRPGYGFCSTINFAYHTVKVYQEISAVHFGVVKSDKNFGNIDVTARQRKIFWEDIPNPKYPEECLTFDGIPFIVLGRKLLGCKQGVGKLSGKKRKADDTTTTTTTQSKWICPAHISMIEVFKFPDYAIADHSSSTQSVTAERLCYDLNHGHAMGERRFYLFFSSPSEHRDHSVLINGKWVEPELAVGQQIKIEPFLMTEAANDAISVIASTSDVGQRCRILLEELEKKTFTANDETLLQLGGMLNQISDSLTSDEPIEVEVTYPVETSEDLIYSLSNNLDAQEGSTAVGT